jgi:hypothetical protein
MGYLLRLVQGVPGSRQAPPSQLSVLQIFRSISDDPVAGRARPAPAPSPLPRPGGTDVSISTLPTGGLHHCGDVAPGDRSAIYNRLPRQMMN